MKRQRGTWTITRVGLAAAVLSIWGVGCGQDGSEVRAYREVRVRPEAPKPRSSPHGSPSTRPPAALPQTRSSLKWDTPASWKETPGSGMRTASFAMGEAGAEGLGTLITLSGPAGGLEANVARWLGQLGLPVPDGAAFESFLESQEHFETQSGLQGVLVDLVPLTREQGSRDDSMIIGVVSIGSQTAFLKLTGSNDLLEAEKNNLRALSKSIRQEL